MDMNYYRICKSLADKGELVPEGFDIAKFVEDNKGTDLYISLYKYNEKHKKKFDEKGTISGITDTVSSHLIWDLDGKDFEKVRKDAITILDRLEEVGLEKEKAIVSFSGNKGLHIEMEIDKDLTVEEYKHFTKSIAKDLETFDPKINNPSRLIRLHFTKHQDSGLYKTPLEYDELLNMSVKEIKKLAKEGFDGEVIFDKASIPGNLLAITKDDMSERSKNSSGDLLSTEADLDYSKRPKWLSPRKYALLNGYFPEGTRSYALMILASTYKSQGMPKEVTYHALKGAAELQAERFDTDKFPKSEIWDNIINVVYSDTWNGGTYSEDNFPDDLIEYLDNLNVPTKIESSEEDAGFKSSGEVFSSFKNFAENIDKNTIKTGIGPLDDIKDFRITTSMLVGLLGAPSSGKCHGFDTEILMYDGSIKKVQDIKVGDKIMGNDSTPRTVLSLARGREEMFKVHHDNGFYTVNKSHILSIKNVQNRMLAGIKTGEVKNLSVSEYLNLSKDAKRRLKGYRVPVDFKEKRVSMSPYLIGAWLGDGSFKNPVITNEDVEIYSHLKKEANKYGIDMRVVEHEKKSTSLRFTTKERLNPFRTYIYEKCRDENGKRAPKEMLINSRKVRSELLAGIIDTDGYYDEQKGSFEVTFKEEGLMKDLQFLCRSLGLKCTVKPSRKGIKSLNFWGDYYRAYIVGDFSEIPVKLSRRIHDNREKRGDVTTYQPKLESIGVGDYYGFELDGNHLYCLGDFSVTHNTSVTMEILKSASMSGQQVAFFSMDMGAPLVFQRLAQKVSGHHQEKLFEIFKNNELDEINKIKQKINDQYGNVHFSFKTAMTTAGIRKGIMDLEKEHGKIRIAAVDYLECISASISDPTAKVSMISQELKDIATDLDVCVLLLLQPPKRVGDPSKPILSYTDIKGAATVAQACSIVLSLWREGFNPKTTDLDNYISFAAIKNRMGKLCQIDCTWDGLTGKIGYMEEIQRQDLEDLRKMNEIKGAIEDDF